jgi:hypothetical protein
VGAGAPRLAGLSDLATRVWLSHLVRTPLAERDGLLIGVTYGLSLTRRDSWQVSRPELSISVRSDDAAWVLAIAHLVEQLRHDCPFSYGDTINFGEPVAAGSSRDGFAVFGPLAFGPDDTRVDVGDDLPIMIVGLYPT